MDWGAAAARKVTVGALRRAMRPRARYRDLLARVMHEQFLQTYAEEWRCRYVLRARLARQWRDRKRVRRHP